MSVKAQILGFFLDVAALDSSVDRTVACSGSTMSVSSHP